MDYVFPKITTIDDVLPHIDDNFIVANKGEYTVINYILPDKETFPPVVDLRSAIRRECRGIIFCNVTGKLLRRSYHKFFNCEEKEEVSEDIVLHKMSKQGWSVLDKLDGSMIVPFKTNSGKLIWGTKMGETHISPRVSEFVDKRPEYKKMFEYFDSAGFSPIFEWYSPEDRIVVDYGDEPCLTLTAVRFKYSGRYISSEELLDIQNSWDIPVVLRHFITMNTIKSDQLNNDTDEGYVVRFDDGHMVKIKFEHYCKVHKAKSSLAKERHIVDLILNEKIDDLKPFLDQDDIKKLEAFEKSLRFSIKSKISTFGANMQLVKQYNVSKKDIALTYRESMPHWLISLIFKFHDKEYAVEDVFCEIKNYILKYCTRDNKYQEFMVDDFLKDVVRWKPVMFSGDN